MIWNNTSMRNGKLVRLTRWAVLPDKRNEMAAIHTFTSGEAVIEARLILEADYGEAPSIVAEAAERFTLARTNRPYVVEDEYTDLPFEEEALPEPEDVRAVVVHAHKTNARLGLVQVSADVLPSVKRVEFWVEDKRVLARNRAPFTTELELGDASKRVALRAIGFDAAGRYVDADAFLLTEGEAPFAVELTYVPAPDGQSHFKLSVINPKRARLDRVALYAGEKKLHEWTRPPFAWSVPTASLAGIDVVRATVVDSSGAEATDEQRLP